MHTALRETHEELGLVVPEDHVWGILQPIYYMVSPPGSEAIASPYLFPGPGAGPSGTRGVVMDLQAWNAVEHQSPAWQSPSMTNWGGARGIFIPFPWGILTLRSGREIAPG